MITLRQEEADLASVLKSARDILRRDKGLNGDLDRLPTLSWLLFVRFLDEGFPAGLTSQSPIPAPYRWRDWASPTHALPVSFDYIDFFREPHVLRPDGTWGPGLFPFLRSLDGPQGDPARVVGAIFRAAEPKLTSSYVARDLVARLDTLSLHSASDIHALGRLYEGMLAEMRDAAGDSGEFYTPRPLVRLAVTLLDPRSGELVLDPACGTGGFLIEASSHADRASSVDSATNQKLRLVGFEAKPLPFLLAQMNSVLHSTNADILLVNTLRKSSDSVTSIRADVVLTNPPFGGTEDPDVIDHYPEALRTSETALLFLQYIATHFTPDRGRAAVVVPNGVLFAGGVAARVRKLLLSQCNLHTILRFPRGVFAPYTSIATNLIFFDVTRPTKGTWFYEHPLPEGRSQYTKTGPLLFEELAPIVDWWSDRAPTPQAWYVPASELSPDLNLDRRNPHSRGASPTETPDAVVQRLTQGLGRVSHALRDIRRERERLT